MAAAASASDAGAKVVVLEKMSAIGGNTRVGEGTYNVADPELLEHRGELSTFVVYIQYRQNATWQGDIVWVEQGAMRSFRSALEMLKLMDNA